MEQRGKKQCLLGMAIGIALLLAGCGNIILPNPQRNEGNTAAPVILEISFDPTAPGDVALTWSEEAAAMLDVTVIGGGPGDPEITVKITPHSVR